MADDSDDPQTGQALYSEEDEPATGTAAAKPDPGGPRSSSISTLSEASDPDADAEGEPDDLDADADGIEDDEAMDYSFGLPARNRDDDGEEDDSGEEEESDDEDADEDSGEEMELDENASSPPPSPPSRLSEQPHQLDAEATKKPLVLKLKLASQPANVAAPAARPAKRKYVRKAPISKSPAGRPRTTSNKKAGTSARRRDTDEEDELADDALGSDNTADDRPNQSGLYQAWDESDGGSSGDDATPNVGQLTVRQRAKEYGEQVTDLQSLPMSKKKKELTEADRAMEKAEKSRKRKHQNEKKLEDEKTETINRLLKGQIGKAGRGGGSKAAAALDATDDASAQLAQAARPPSPPPLPTMIRHISSIRSGEYIVGLSIPQSALENYCRDVPLSNAPGVVYPPRVRPPPQTWKLVNGVRVN